MEDIDNPFKNKEPVVRDVGKRFIRIGLITAIILFVCTAVLIVFIVWGSINYFSKSAAVTEDQSVKTYNWSLLGSIRDSWGGLMNKFTNDKDEANTVIKVVDEQSQVIEVVKKNSPAVVSIIASAEVPKLEQCYQNAPMYGVPQEFQQFFNFQFPAWCQNGTEKRRIGAGTGFVLSSDGYIVTNKHVVADENAEYTVVLNDEKNLGKKIVAQVLARDPSNDIAILKIEESDLPFVVLGDSDNLDIGQTVVAIGYSLGEFDNTVSKGVVSGLSRKITAGISNGGYEKLNNLIQTDAAINPGNSGGPLLDISGKAIGINTAMADAQSIGFAIPINLVKLAFDQVKETGTIEKVALPWLGVRYIPITDELKTKNNLPYDYGMLVIRGDTVTDLAVMPGSPADKAGIVENDIILEVDGKKLNERYLLSDAIQEKKPGDEIKLKVFHKGEEKTVKLNLSQQ